MKNLLRTLSLTLALLLSFSACGALADATLVSSRQVDSYASLGRTSNTYYARTDNGYVLFDADGTALSAAYGDMSRQQYGLFYRVINENGLNTYGLLDGTGRLIMPLQYGDIEILSERWVLGIVLADSTDGNGEYHDSQGNRFVISRVDVYFDGNLIGALSREDYAQNQSVGAHGAFMYVKKTSSQGFYLSGNFVRVDYTADYFPTSEFEDVYKKGVFHRASGQQAFVNTCTLTPDQVERSVWYDDNGDFIDLQGNVISHGVLPSKEYDSVYDEGGDYLRVRSGGKTGLVTRTGEEVLPAIYDELGGDGTSYYALGYQAVIQDGVLKYLDRSGAVLVEVPYKLNSSSDYKGFMYNAPFVVMESLGQAIVVTAEAGELAQRYEDYYRPATAEQRILSVKLNGLWGAIGTNGETVIPFIHGSNLEISDDGTLAIGYTAEGRDYVVYQIEYSDNGAPQATAAPAVEAPAEQPAAADGWVCPSCGQTVTSNFCPNDGTAKPAQAPVCKQCGFQITDGSTPNFCPNCGAKME